MPSYSTAALLSTLATHTEAFLQKAVSEWQVLPHLQFSQQPAPGKWSANQCLAHLNEYGRYYLPAIETAIDAAVATRKTYVPVFRSGWLGHYFTKMMLTDAQGKPQKKMSAPKSYSPQNTGESYAVVAEFIEQQERLLALLQKAKQVDPGSVRVPISIAPWIKLKLGDVFLFLIAHNYRHIMQADRALRPLVSKQPSALPSFLLTEMIAS